MASIETYSTESGRRYRVHYRDPERRSREKGGFRTKHEAQVYLATLSVATARGEYIDPSAAKRTIGDLGPAWLAAQTHLKPSSFAPLEATWRVYVAPRWTGTELRYIRHSDVQVWVSQLMAGTAPTTTTPRPLRPTSVHRAHSVLASILDLAVRDRRISTNPARGVNLPRKVGKRHIYLTHQQVEVLARCAGGKDTLVRFLCYTGLRWGEATALRVRDLDLARGRVTVAENAVRVNGHIIVGTPKSHHSRSVPVPLFLIGELEERCAGRSENELVFGNGGAYLQQPTAKGGWYVAAKRRAQRIDPEFPKPTIHDLRHTAASLAVSSGANVKAVQRMLGHASAAMTLDVYTDLFDEDLEAVSAALDHSRASALVGFLWGLGPEEASAEGNKPGNMRI
jgi:integrase